MSLKVPKPDKTHGFPVPANIHSRGTEPGLGHAYGHTQGSPASAEVVPSYTAYQHACLTLDARDCLRLIHFPPQITSEVVRDALKHSWKRGIQTERTYAESHEFKLCGYPWHGTGKDAVTTRTMMGALNVTTDVSRKSYDTDSLFFRYNGAVVPQPSTFFAIAFNQSDLIRLIEAPSDVLQAVQHLLSCNVQKESWKIPDAAYDFKLKGYPWYASGENAVTARVLLLQLLDVLTTVGFEIYASIDMTTDGTTYGFLLLLLVVSSSLSDFPFSLPLPFPGQVQILGF
ncbi:hypothetical protein BOTBODRAFT_178287 [Botryobasidium botryosum FD-172 SS1]|uniref:Uncharacterized protein n=1 Tax=Botryobasidium botryosum (strain FD-172 SS1) TaxID=930990 RepID=A0A067M3W9_BOTB1|nr:hypothetical protein BOTBODRAFT_178287 [Botryobasidium botryosum FD-172 SS1]